jgi:hypothetical protein
LGKANALLLQDKGQIGLKENEGRKQWKKRKEKGGKVQADFDYIPGPGGRRAPCAIGLIPPFHKRAIKFANNRGKLRMWEMGE